MAKLQEYVTSGGKRLRCGYTTGTCAAAAARAAAELLLSGTLVPAVRVDTPAGVEVVVDVEEHEAGPGWARCAVRKDSGDDPDVTNGAMVHAKVSVGEPAGAADGVEVRIDGGVGVGRVTREGLDQPVGAAAINHVPRQMIAAQVREAAAAAGFAGALDVEVSIPAGVELAARTFNPRLGIEGGISVLGTSGIVKPMSEDALVASIELELRMLRARGVRDVLMSPGNYGCDFARDALGLDVTDMVQCSNYLGATLDACALEGFSRVLVVGHIGKMAKVACGNMNTHSRTSDGRAETVAAHAALAGAPRDVTAAVMGAPTTDAMLDVLDGAGLLAPVMASLTDALADKLAHRARGAFRCDAVVFSNVRGVLGQTPGAAEALRLFAACEGDGAPPA